MFALEIEYLTGRAVASGRDDRDTAEWPPHPGRLFMALVAAHCEHDSIDAAERAALRWLECQPPPALWATGTGRREVHTVFVPVNDNMGPDIIPRTGFTAGFLAEKVKVLPERRSKQPRTFPSVSPAEPRVVLLWEQSEPAEAAAHLPALARLAARVAYLGHSASLVRVAVCNDPPRPTLRPADDGTLVLRAPTPGRLDELLATYAAGRRPTAGFYCGYAEADRPVEEAGPETTFGRLVVFRLLNGPTLPLEVAPRLTAAVRDSLMSLCPVQPPPELLSGHDQAGAPSRCDHAAILPLAFVAHRRADGSIKGFAVALPRDCSDSDRTTALRVLGLLKRIKLGRPGAWEVERMAADPPLHSLRVGPYVGPARDWASVTPVVFDRFPKRRDGKDHAALIAASCRRIGLPAPADVEIGPVSRLLGAPPSRAFASSRVNAALPPRPRWHVALRFDCPVRGPVVLGSGRYLGLGLFRSCDDRIGGWRRP